MGASMARRSPAGTGEAVTAGMGGNHPDDITSQPTTTALEIARRELRRGRQPIPVPYRSKAPILDGWQRLMLTEAELPRYFNGQPQNIGILNGAPSGNQVDVDLDWALAHRLAPRFLPPTGAVFGRPSSPRSHWLYVADPLEPTKAFDDPTGKHGAEGARIAEYRSTGSQTVWPGSVHESGETIRWDEDGEPAQVDGRALKAAVGKLAAAALLARHWPAEGSRHDAALALAGGLLRAAWPVEDAAAFIEAVATAAGDEEVADRVRAVATTERAMRERRATTGWKRLAEFVDGRVVDRVREWLGVPANVGDIEVLPDRVAPEPPWPVMDDAAYYGVAGEVVEALDPHTEADPVAVLASFLTLFGAAAGRSPHVMIGEDRHGANLFGALVGDSSKARKGSSRSGPERIIAAADPGFADRIVSGVGSGEGIIWAIRDPITRFDPKSGEEKETDPGVEDKRLAILEEELGAVLKVCERQGNTLSPVLRRAWDSRERIQSLTKNAPATATNPHVAVLAHITMDELRRSLTEAEIANGLGNRFVWFCVRRSKCLPRPQPLPLATIDALAQKVRAALRFARQCSPLAFDEEAGEAWDAIYPTLSAAKPGLAGALLARAEAQTIRLALIYAVLDQSPVITFTHLEAALALMDYGEASVRFVWGDATGDPIADRILRALRANGPMDQSAVSELFGRHVGAARLGQALETLVAAGRIRGERQETGGRPRIVWEATR